jgi:hypothetical protein
MRCAATSQTRVSAASLTVWLISLGSGAAFRLAVLPADSERKEKPFNVSRPRSL